MEDLNNNGIVKQGQLRSFGLHADISSYDRNHIIDKNGKSNIGSSKINKPANIPSDRKLLDGVVFSPTDGIDLVEGVDTKTPQAKK